MMNFRKIAAASKGHLILRYSPRILANLGTPNRLKRLTLADHDLGHLDTGRLRQRACGTRMVTGPDLPWVGERADDGVRLAGYDPE